MKYPKLRDLDWLAEQLKIRSMRDIAAEVGCSYSAVVYVTRAFGVQHPRWRKAKRPEGLEQKLKDALRAKYPNGRRGELAANWRGGIRTRQTYVLLYDPTHPNAEAAGYVLAQRQVMSNALGRPLLATELVHHINGDKKDNRLENLELVSSKKEHSRRHFDAVKVIDKLRADPALALRIKQLEDEIYETSTLVVTSNS